MSRPRAMVPFEVVAELSGGISFGMPWGIGLDGLLASVIWHRERDPLRQTRALEAENVADLDLPLARCTRDEHLWHWAATTSRLEGVVGEVEAHHSTQTLDARAIEKMTSDLPVSIDPGRGRWRRRYIPHLVTIVARARWRGVGHVDVVADLLGGIETIGKRRGAGEGQVLSWSVRELEDVGELDAAHLHADGSLGRPCPPACLDRLGWPAHGGMGVAAIRPPAMHPSRIAGLYLPALA